MSLIRLRGGPILNLRRQENEHISLSADLPSRLYVCVLFMYVLCMLCACMCVGIHMHMHVYVHVCGYQKPAWSAFFNGFLLYFLRQDFSLNLELGHSSQTE